MESFAGQVAVVTGGSSGIGKATAVALAQRGAEVCIVGRDLKKLRAVGASAPSATLRCYAADLTSDADLKELALRLQRECQHIHILVHSAGVISLSPVEVAAIEDFDRQYRANLRAPFLLTQLLLPALRPSHGQVVFMNSSAALRPGPAVSQYAATKAGLRVLADSLRDEVNADGMRVLTVFIGRTATPMQTAVHRYESKEYHPKLLMQPEDVATAVISALALPRTAEVTEITMRPSCKT